MNLNDMIKKLIIILLSLWVAATAIGIIAGIAGVIWAIIMAIKENSI
ncbi:MAG: hypothetical protein FWF00_00310 [Endomicrobia bacterium]|nr:hypothetical protein [Endomicrobiia bacterium]MCL2506120.1 hypothetical protein [Endomicrobiia bacterium]